LTALIALENEAGAVILPGLQSTLRALFETPLAGVPTQVSKVPSAAGDFLSGREIVAHNVMSAASLLRPAFFGRLAGRASARLRSRASSRPVKPRAFFAVASSDEQQVRDLLKRIHTYRPDDESYFDLWKGWTCRPSGNPASQEMMKAMMDSKDVTGVSGDLIDIKMLDFSEDRTMAYSAVVASATFSYKGTPNDDVYVFTNVFKKVDGVWETVWGHRSTGRSPDEDPPAPWP